MQIDLLPVRCPAVALVAEHAVFVNEQLYTQLRCEYVRLTNRIDANENRNENANENRNELIRVYRVLPNALVLENTVALNLFQRRSLRIGFGRAGSSWPSIQVEALSDHGTTASDVAYARVRVRCASNFIDSEKIIKTFALSSLLGALRERLHSRLVNVDDQLALPVGLKDSGAGSPTVQLQFQFVELYDDVGVVDASYARFSVHSVVTFLLDSESAMRIQPTRAGGSSVLVIGGGGDDSNANELGYCGRNMRTADVADSSTTATATSNDAAVDDVHTLLGTAPLSPAESAQIADRERIEYVDMLMARQRKFRCFDAVVGTVLPFVFDNPRFADVELRVGANVDDEQSVFYAHKGFLAAASPVFERSFSSGFREAMAAGGAPVVVELADLGARATRCMLAWAYYRDVFKAPPLSDDPASALQLIRFAHRHEIAGLVDYGEMALLASLGSADAAHAATVLGAFEVFERADGAQHALAFLKARIVTTADCANFYGFRHAEVRLHIEETVRHRLPPNDVFALLRAVHDVMLDGAASAVSSDDGNAHWRRLLRVIGARAAETPNMARALGADEALESLDVACRHAELRAVEALLLDTLQRACAPSTWLDVLASIESLGVSRLVDAVHRWLVGAAGHHMNCAATAGDGEHVHRWLASFRGSPLRRDAIASVRIDLTPASLWRFVPALLEVADGDGSDNAVQALRERARDALVARFDELHSGGGASSLRSSGSERDEFESMVALHSLLAHNFFKDALAESSLRDRFVCYFAARGRLLFHSDALLGELSRAELESIVGHARFDLPNGEMDVFNLLHRWTCGGDIDTLRELTETLVRSAQLTPAQQRELYDLGALVDLETPRLALVDVATTDVAQWQRAKMLKRPRGARPHWLSWPARFDERRCSPRVMLSAQCSVASISTDKADWHSVSAVRWDRRAPLYGCLVYLLQVESLESDAELAIGVCCPKRASASMCGFVNDGARLVGDEILPVCDKSLPFFRSSSSSSSSSSPPSSMSKASSSSSIKRFRSKFVRSKASQEEQRSNALFGASSQVAVVRIADERVVALYEGTELIARFTDIPAHCDTLFVAFKGNARVRLSPFCQWTGCVPSRAELHELLTRWRPEEVAPPSTWIDDDSKDMGADDDEDDFISMRRWSSTSASTLRDDQLESGSNGGGEPTVDSFVWI
jgi:BTB/POZ domain